MGASRRPRVKVASEPCFACKRSGTYYRLNGAGLERVGEDMVETEKGKAHRDCLA